MKKLLLILFSMTISLGAFAQKGKSEVGINFDIAPTFSTNPVSANIGIGAKYRYGISNKFRLDANFTYLFPSVTELDEDEFDKIKMWDVSVNIQYLLKLKDKLCFYPLAGLGYVDVSCNDDYESNGNSISDANHDKNVIDAGGKSHNIVFNVGAGLEYTISDHLNASIELKYPVMISHVDPVIFTLGVCYKF